MSYSDEHLDQLLQTSGEQWRASQPELEPLGVAILVRQRAARQTIYLPLASVASLAVVLLATVALVALFVAGPFGGGKPTFAPSLALPTHKDLNGSPAALLDATLVLDGQCLYATQGTESRWLPIWPSGFSMAGDAVTDRGVQVARVGDSVRLVGGEYHESQYDFLRSLMPADVPAACRGGDYWLVGEVVAISPAASPSTSTETPTPSAGTTRAVADCSAVIDKISPMVTVRSGKVAVAAAYEVNGEQLTRYFVTELNGSNAFSNGEDWWNQPNKLVDLCILDGDFNTETPGPPGHDTTAVRVLVVIDGSEAFPWAFCFSYLCSIPTTDPATLLPPTGPVPTLTTPPGTQIALWTSAGATIVNGHEVCNLMHLGGVLARQPESGLGLRNERGDVDPIIWPYGFSAREVGGVALLIDRKGAVAAREGDRVAFAGGLSPNVDGVYEACGGVEVVKWGDNLDPVVGAINRDTVNFGGVYLDENGVLVIQYVGENGGRAAVEQLLPPGAAVRWVKVDRSRVELDRIQTAITDRIAKGEADLGDVFSVAIDTVPNQVLVSLFHGSVSEVSQLLAAEYGDAVRVEFNSDIPVAPVGLPSPTP